MIHALIQALGRYRWDDQKFKIILAMWDSEGKEARQATAARGTTWKVTLSA